MPSITRYDSPGELAAAIAAMEDADPFMIIPYGPGQPAAWDLVTVDPSNNVIAVTIPAGSSISAAFATGGRQIIGIAVDSSLNGSPDFTFQVSDNLYGTYQPLYTSYGATAGNLVAFTDPSQNCTQFAVGDTLQATAGCPYLKIVTSSSTPTMPVTAVTQTYDVNLRVILAKG